MTDFTDPRIHNPADLRIKTDIKSLSPLAEFLDMLMTRAAIALAPLGGRWSVYIHPWMGDSGCVKLTHHDEQNKRITESHWSVHDVQTMLGSQFEGDGPEAMSERLDRGLEEFVETAKGDIPSAGEGT